jgi:hypothetical protein
MDESLRRKAETSGEWLISQVKKEAALTDSPFEDWDDWVLRQSFEAFSEEDHPHVLMTHNDTVRLIRSAILRAKKAGVPTIKVRPGLSLPTNWQAHYQVVFTTELPWVISAAMQNAFFGNPADGEEKPWNSDRVIREGAKSAVKWGVVGGVIASLLGG